MSGITITELAERCGVAVSTVSRAMNDRSGISARTRERILQVARETGYVPNTAAKNLKISSTGTVAVVFQGWTSELLNHVLDTVRDQLTEAGLDLYSVHVSDHDANTATIVRLVTERRLAGLVFLGRFGDKTLPDDPALRDYLAGVGIPVVFCTTRGLTDDADAYPSISVDDRAGAAELTRHLLSLGHRRIAFGPATAGFPLESNHVWALRYRGYRDALSHAGIVPEDGWLIPSTDPDDIYTMANGYHSVSEWLVDGAAPRGVTAIVTSCDAAGLGAMRAARDAGLRVPDDISVTGFDGLDFARYSTPSLTTVVQPTAEIARETSRYLVRAITENARDFVPPSIRGSLLVGESTATIPAPPGADGEDAELPRVLR